MRSLVCFIVSIFEVKPIVAGFCKSDETFPIEFLGRNLFEEFDISSFCLLDIVIVVLGEFLSSCSCQFDTFVWIEQIPIVVSQNSFHKFIRDPQGSVQASRSYIVITVGFFNIQKFIDIIVPWFHIDNLARSSSSTLHNGIDG